MTPTRTMFGLIAIVLLLLAGGLRLASLTNRPVHTDEAVHAEKLGDLLERGTYTYDPHEFHGPTLNYASHAVARLRGHHTHAALDEFDLRLPAAIVGILLLAGVLLLRPIGRGEILAALAAVATCHELVFFSRYSIQEIFLVCFTLYAAIAIHRALASPAVSSRWLWAIFAGLFVGLAHSTKETWVLSLPAAAIALGIVAWRFRPKISRRSLRHLWLILPALAVATGVAYVLLTNFGKNPAALGDSISTYWNYLRRAAGDAAAMSADRHAHPFYRYAEWLFYSPTKGWLYTEIALLLLAMAGFAAGWKRSTSLTTIQHQWRVGLGIYTAALFAIYSVLTYKTPWCMLGVILPLCLLAGCGAMDLLRRAKRTSRSAHAIATGALLVVLAFQTVSAYRASFVDLDNEANPNVYAHTTNDIHALGALFERWRVMDPKTATTTNIKIFVASIDCYWPLPWYLRRFHHLDDPNHPNPTARPELILLVAPPGHMASLQSQMMDYLYGDTFPEGQKPLLVPPILPALRKRIWLRSDIELRIYVTMKLNERMYETLAQESR